ncbi:MAG: peptide-N-glycosidase F-related protein [Bacteroidales bacterium]|nr:peptide-N-glycosidase F-related protein [Bacteroidales bacterium]MDD3664444.1 peptide-N-glycosidase F-related protein [Bacteroidales bacterium]
MNKVLYSFRFFMVAVMLCLSVQLMSQSNQYLHFDRVDDWVSTPNGESYVLNSTQGVSMAGWFFSDDLSYGQGMMGFRGGATEFYMIQIGDGKLECRYISSTGFHEYVGPANTIIPQVWQHLALVYNGSTLTLYVNGNVKGSAAASGVLTDGTVPFAIGKSPVGSFQFYFGGRADEVSVWNKGLTQTEIQDMMQNELTGSEAGLQMYYKFNQGVPGGNNTAITKLTSEVESPARDGDLLNFALTGNSSNFLGTLDPSFQAIAFPPIPNKLTTSEPFTIEATATSGLPVSFAIISGPATIDGNLITLSGDTGLVTVEATQAGGGQYNAATPVRQRFMVLSPTLHVPEIDIRHPLAGDVYMSSLSPLELATVSEITYPELFFVANVKFIINGQTIMARNYWNGHYTGWWTPPAYGNYVLEVQSTNNFGAVSSKTVAINIAPTATNMDVIAVQDVLINTANNSKVVTAELPSFLAAFDTIMATLTVSCPAGGCGEWDRVAWIEARGHDGEWYEIIRYITPYGKACSHTINLTDYAMVLRGKIDFRVNCETLDNGYVYDLNLTYKAGTPPYKYSFMQKVWNDTYQFGDYANLQPVELFDYEFPANTEAAKLKLVSTGHGWGSLNTSNAAEFYNATHSIWVDGVKKFDQLNWQDCNPNPDGCQPQNGTWYHDRAGWCPGAIARWFDFDMTQFVAAGNIEMQYKFYENYVDLCHPNHPDCVTGVTCSNCDDGFNPHLIVASHIVTFANSPIIVVGQDQPAMAREAAFNANPNPTKGKIELSLTGNMKIKSAVVSVYNLSGKVVSSFMWDGSTRQIDFTGFPRGLYFIQLQGNGFSEAHKIVLQ